MVYIAYCVIYLERLVSIVSFYVEVLQVEETSSKGYVTERGRFCFILRYLLENTVYMGYCVTYLERLVSMVFFYVEVLQVKETSSKRSVTERGRFCFTLFHLTVSFRKHSLHGLPCNLP